MYKVKFSNGKILSFFTKDELLCYVSGEWSVQTYQVKIEDNYIYLTTKLGNMFAMIGIIE